jgi:RND family efflux transporter MFP subunit
MMRNRIWTGMQLLALGALVFTAACSTGEAAARDADTDTSQAGPSARVINVEVVETSLESFTDEVTLTGNVEAERDVVVSAEEGGVVREILVPKGRRVSEGEPLIRVDARVLQAQFDQMRAEAQLAEETWQRQKKLWEADSIGSEMSYLQAKYRAAMAEANARLAQTRLERATITAPIGGVLDDRMVEIGSTVAVGSPVVRIIDADPLKVTAGVPERYAGEVRTGTSAELTFESGQRAVGRVTFVGTAVNEDNRTFEVEIRVPNPDATLKPGMVATVRLQRGVETRAILVPRDAVLRGENGYIVYVVTERDGASVAESRLVRTGAGAAGRVVLQEGVQPGEKVIVVGQQQVAAGDRVQITNEVGAGI